VATYTVTHEKPESFYDRYFRKSDLQHQTHYCPGCGHGIVHKLVASALDEMGLQDRTIFVSPVGCSVFAYYYFDVGNIQAAHGRAAAVAIAAKRAHPESIVISYQGDGDLAAIGTGEIIHAANRGENITVIFINNAVYGMTGGQMAPTTLIGQKTTTTPFGRSVSNEGYPLRVCELLAALEAPVYLERVALSDNKGIMRAGKAVRRAIENQVRGLGFSLVEVLSPCPTIWRKTPVDAQHWVAEEMIKAFPLGVYRDRTKTAQPLPELPPPPPPEGEPAPPQPTEPIPPAEGRWTLTVAATDDQGFASTATRRFSVNSTLGFLRLEPVRLFLPPGGRSATILWTQVRAARVKVTLETLDGIVLRTLAQRRLEPGDQAVVWDGRRRDGKLAAGGRYTVRVEASNELGAVALEQQLTVRRIAGTK